MALGVKDKETDRFARWLAALSDEIWTDAIRKALAERWNANDCAAAGLSGWPTG